MGFDLYGMNPENDSQLAKPEINWDKVKEDKDREKYFDKLHKYQNEVPGDYFRANVWYWRPLWEYVCIHCKGIVTEKDVKSGGYNDGHKISKTKSKRIAARLRRIEKNGLMNAYINDREEYLNALPDEWCEVCDGKGTRDGWEGWETKDKWLKHHDELSSPLNDSQMFPPGKVSYEWAKECKGCNGCKGTGRKKNFQCSYGLCKEYIQEFMVFCEKSGGFEIC